MKNYFYTAALWSGLGAVLGLSACRQNSADYAAHDAVANNRDTTVKPGDDFFSYANGGWLKRNPIPAAYSGWGIGNIVQEDIRTRLRKINEDALKSNAAKGSNMQKIGDFYYSGMDTVVIEKQGLSPLNAELAKINQITDVKSLLDEFAHLSNIGVTTPIGAVIAQDAKNSSKMMLQLYQSGIGLPNRDYYYNTDPQSVKLRADYQQQHLPVLLKLSGMQVAEASGASAKVYALEKALADSSRKLENLRDPYKNYHKMPVAALSKLVPEINWKDLFDKMDYKGADTVIVGQPEYYRALSKALKTVPVADWKVYLRKNLISEYSPYLSNKFNDENFRFYGMVLSGRKAQLPRWKRVLDVENNLMGEVLGQLFVKEYFPEAEKKTLC